MKIRLLTNHLGNNSPLKAGFKVLMVLIACCAIAACGGNKKAKKNDGEPSADITRPPQTIVGRTEVQERDPEETISFDEWRKRRLEELNKQQPPEE